MTVTIYAASSARGPRRAVRDVGADLSWIEDASERPGLIEPGTLVIGTELMSDVTVMSVAGEVDLATTERFAGALRMHLADGARTAVIDLVEVGFISSGGGRVLLATVHEARQGGVIVRLVLSRAVRRVVELLELVAESPTGSGPAGLNWPSSAAVDAYQEPAL